MAQRLITGIYPSCDPKALESALAAQSIDPAQVRVVARDVATDAHDDSAIDFVDVAQAMESNSLSDDLTRGMGIMGDAGGTGVPGINNSTTSLSGLVGGHAGNNYLAGLPIPGDQVQNYNDAIDDGRCVVTLAVDDAGAAGAVAAFQAAGLRNVHAF